ncbi:diadenylate cyclase CdaA [Psychroserpens sp.]|uniref:diadenylate cyclase CdaA n=1 Tax=Psychroserpens sp. TaxID=2020870 RepID=UPI001B0ECD92|nr:diadenylate cyclase CdaA [Psychroserpens sp.]MBO6607661.1 TIGR00159 family protein [Psychroserpens sp.]MBO6655027.1 TIGR00159 family protein [Psychroserpens sp.]MBO6683168.1 TIGR00159 family protein [Psychroserpens sp.]MBO6749653.1 TIGR00159 family protein [Psychroserpens sp.]MBO6916577.1 TIGR00159 family protein [Psychroserpens sp.]
MEKFKFWEFGIVDFIDVFLVAILLYYVYKLIKGTVAVNIFIGIIIIYLVWRVTDFLEMHMLHRIFDGFIKVGIIALIVVFQPEIRKFLLMVGSTNLGGRGKLFRKINFLKNEEDSETDVVAIVSACQKMSSTKTGALIVIERNNSLDFLVNTGDEMTIKVTQPIIESIFFKNSPLHDGAIIIENNVVKATRVILPVNNEKTIPQRFGLRHRAAVGITEKTDAIALVVSEETGQISYIKNGEFIMFEDFQELTTLLNNELT